ncbi:MAG TPA: ergothioneine biosynthesis protein EgtB [Woeseiaceae bacterium]|nr:ergothioneine biosynthesis protein EgtB [Woeseiaceae bacterium]
MASSAKIFTHTSSAPLVARYTRIRALTVYLCAALAPEDTVIQSMPDVSPTKWHLAHITWFFERFVLLSHVRDYRVFNEDFDFLFNSYYYTAGQMHARSQRGLLSRPTFAEVLQYRQHVDDAMLELIESRAGEMEFAALVTLGLNHEQQHQELLLTDIKHVFSCNPMMPAVIPDLPAVPGGSAPSMTFSPGKSGVQAFGATGERFCFDNETPRHTALLQEHRIADRLVSNGEYREFIRDKAYTRPELWLSDGWAVINERGWNRPLYWQDDLESEFTLGGLRDIESAAPVAHISFYEADAFARWAGARLPTEFEWESAVGGAPVEGNLLDSRFLQPVPQSSGKQFFGDAWEWTSSAYAAYPGFKPLAGSLGEYNGKFMCNQMTVRGGSCVTSADHIRASYRSFFYPDARWQFLGLRLARDGVA